MLEQAAGMLIKSILRMCTKKNYSSLEIEYQHLCDHHLLYLVPKKHPHTYAKFFFFF